MAAGTRRAHVLQRSAGKMFHQWGEALGARLNEMVNNDKLTSEQMAATLSDPEKQKQLLQQDEEEDFLDESKCGSAASEEDACHFLPNFPLQQVLIPTEMIVHRH